MAKSAHDLFWDLKRIDDDIAFHEQATRRLRDERMALFPDLKLAFHAADGRPVTFEGKLYRAALVKEELVDVVATEVATPFDLEMPEPAEDPEDDEFYGPDELEQDLRFGAGPRFPDRVERPAGEDPAFRFEPGRGDGS